MKIKLLKKPRLLPINYSTSNIVPIKYMPYLFDLNCLYSIPSSGMILDREDEIEKIINCLRRRDNKNAILIGEHGVGKTATLQRLVYNVSQGKCPEELKYIHFLYLDISSIIAYFCEKETQKKLKNIINFIITSQNIAVVIDQVHLTQINDKLSYYFSLLVKQPHIGVIGLTTDKQFYQYFEYDSKTRSKLEIIPIKEPRPEKVYSMIRKVVKHISDFHKVTISKDLIRYITCLSGAFSTELADPALTLDIAEKAMIYAKKRKDKQVNKDDINKSFNFNYKLYNNMNVEEKKIIAYHEAGHFIVAKLSNNIKNLKPTAISIVPAENYMGVTTFEFQIEKQTSCDIDYYIDNIAVDLAGRVAETILKGTNSKKYTSGANIDLANATNIARDIITQYGMIEEYGENMAFLGNYSYCDFSLLSNKDKLKINKATKKLIDIAYNRAQHILRSNLPLLDNIARELLKNEILDAKDLDKLCRQYEKGKQLYKELMEEEE